MTTQKTDYLDDFLGDFEVDNEFSNFGQKSSAISSAPNGLAEQKQTNDWSIPIGEINEDIQSLSEDENNEVLSNDAEEPAKSNANNNAEVDDQDDSQPVIKNASNNTWSGVQFEQSKLTSVFDSLNAKNVKPAASTGVYGAYKPKEQTKFTSRAIQGGAVDFPAIGETPKEEKPEPVAPKVSEPKPASSSYSSSMSAYQPKSATDYAKALQNVTISQSKPVEPAKPVVEEKKEPAPVQSGYQAGGYKPKYSGYAAKATQPAVSPAPEATPVADGSYRQQVTSSYASKFKK